jgi:hypothetical protein
VTTLLLLCVEGFWLHREYGDLGVNVYIDRFVRYRSVPLDFADRMWLWFDERLMSANGTKRTFQDVRYLSAFGGKADITPRVLKIAKLLQ